MILGHNTRREWMTDMQFNVFTVGGCEMTRCCRSLVLVGLLVLSFISMGLMLGCDTETEVQQRKYSDREIVAMTSNYLREQGRRAPCSASEVRTEVIDIGNDMWVVGYHCPQGMWAAVSVHPESDSFGLV